MRYAGILQTLQTCLPDIGILRGLQGFLERFPAFLTVVAAEVCCTGGNVGVGVFQSHGESFEALLGLPAKRAQQIDGRLANLRRPVLHGDLQERQGELVLANRQAFATIGTHAAVFLLGELLGKVFRPFAAHGSQHHHRVHTYRRIGILDGFLDGGHGLGCLGAHVAQYLRGLHAHVDVAVLEQLAQVRHAAVRPRGRTARRSAGD